MYLDTSHQTVTCPQCKKDSWLTRWEEGYCMRCDARIKYGKLAKKKR